VDNKSFVQRKQKVYLKRKWFMRSVKKNHQKIIGIVYDFDGTLSPNNMQEDTIFPAYGIDKNEMWAKADYLVRKMGYERTLAYLKLFIHDEAFSHKPIQKEKLKSLAKEICYFEGVKDFFKTLMSGYPKFRKLRNGEFKSSIMSFLVACRVFWKALIFIRTLKELMPVSMSMMSWDILFSRNL
jgi:hypothetical protein